MKILKTFNRTFMELKQIISPVQTFYGELLIAPLWN